MAETAFQKLARERGVDLEAERERANRQLDEGVAVEGMSESTEKKQREMKETQLMQKKPLQAQGFQTMPEEKPGGLNNVVDVLKIAVNPFSEKRIVSTTDNRVFKTAAEYVANDPYAVAAILSGGANLINAGIKSAEKNIGIGMLPKQWEVEETAKGSAYVANTKVATQTASMIAKVMTQMKKPAYVLGAVGAVIGTYPWAEWALEEAKEGMIFGAGKAISTGDVEVIAQFQAESDVIFDNSLWEKIARLTPGAKREYEFSQKAKALKAQKKVNDKIINDVILEKQTGETDDAKWKRVKEEEDAQDKAAVDYYNEQRKNQVTWEQEARAAADKATRESEKKARNEDAEFWAKEEVKAKQREEDDRKAIADFWTAYRKTQAKIQENNRPSNLNFGLLR